MSASRLLSILNERNQSKLNAGERKFYQCQHHHVKCVTYKFMALWNKQNHQTNMKDLVLRGMPTTVSGEGGCLRNNFVNVLRSNFYTFFCWGWVGGGGGGEASAYKGFRNGKCLKIADTGENFLPFLCAL